MNRKRLFFFAAITLLTVSCAGPSKMGYLKLSSTRLRKYIRQQGNMPEMKSVMSGR